MAVIVVGGHSRSVGKTSVVASLIAALPECEWTAVKITQFGHGICAVNGAGCGCAPDHHRWALEEQAPVRDAATHLTDTERFLAAGAKRSLWLRTKTGELAEGMPALRSALAGAQNVLIESNSVIRFLRPELYLVLLDAGNPDFKESAREYLDRADAFLLVGGRRGSWKDVSSRPFTTSPAFAVEPPTYLSAEVVELVRSRTAVKSAPNRE
jgi:hypothetical protein